MWSKLCSMDLREKKVQSQTGIDREEDRECDKEKSETFFHTLSAYIEFVVCVQARHSLYVYVHIHM